MSEILWPEDIFRYEDDRWRLRLSSHPGWVARFRDSGEDVDRDAYPDPAWRGRLVALYSRRESGEAFTSFVLGATDAEFARILAATRGGAG